MTVCCARCGDKRDCRTFTVDAVALCALCLDLILREWSVRRAEIGELIQS